VDKYIYQRVCLDIGYSRFCSQLATKPQIDLNLHPGINVFMNENDIEMPYFIFKIITTQIYLNLR